MVGDYYRDVTRLLREAGYERVPGGRGSHEKWRYPGRPTVIVPAKPLRHMANEVLKQAGLPKAF
ncbi:MAG: type II toxin-antitoxin system HicA family toxin [Alphaproteobacteria bacterium]|nr:type II toxin-antitoxin system HicA family toxin [Alphaproteobacteria bacterium]MBU2042643.1 type II toxin-antitoxin system HicA family toxin [Alphaproteobacteria bacterium]MBU2124699.1 type II toxin-antitoxin system HicA family toxin [Alphaproteobacteria bacterium]MBU2207518.1 type II toxin-antitoxin system HicA family toxin [Alphaproteobacteria bacterium]MBU2291149.1 type II toxin-antitoxin system HicA family toxin [Alphaproteobacteria bacterium]